MSEENREYSQNNRMASTHNGIHHHHHRHRRRHGWRIFLVGCWDSDPDCHLLRRSSMA